MVAVSDKGNTSLYALVTYVCVCVASAHIHKQQKLLRKIEARYASLELFDWYMMLLPAPYGLYMRRTRTLLYSSYLRKKKQNAGTEC